jgi:hypothetical protein
MDVEQFYDRHPRRQASEEIEFGREWHENDLRYIFEDRLPDLPVKHDRAPKVELRLRAV